MDTRGILIDTNLPGEYLLSQSNEDIVVDTFKNNRDLYMTEFSLNSLFVLGSRQKIPRIIVELTVMLLSNSVKKILTMNRREMVEIYALLDEWNLDFDDAHLKFIAEREGLKIATFDKHLLKYPEIAIHPSKL